MNENPGITDTMQVALGRARELSARGTLVGYGVVELIGPDGVVKQSEPFANLITTAGDEYYIKKGIANVGTPNASPPSAANGMKLGSGSTAVAKSGAGAALVTYISGSNIAFDAAFPGAAAVGGDTG
jgi:hypothetical protein